MPDPHLDPAHLDQLELYCLDRLCPEHSAQIEEHLLCCERCQRIVEANFDFAQALRVALKAPAATEHEAVALTA